MCQRPEYDINVGGWLPSLSRQIIHRSVRSIMDFEKELAKQEAAALLRQIAKALESDSVESIQIDDLKISLPPEIEIFLEFEAEEGQLELEIEFKWSAPEKKERRGKFEVFKGGQEQWYFRLKASNGAVVLASEGYDSQPAAINGIESVRKNAGLENIEQRTSKAEQPYFVLKAGNNRVIGMSQMYKSQLACHKGMQSVINYAPTADIAIIEA